MAHTSLQDRTASTRRRQTNSLQGLPSEPLGASQAANDEAATSANPSRVGEGARAALVRERAGMQREFDLLLRPVAQHYQFDAEDVRSLRAAVAGASPEAEREMATCVRDWRILVVTYNLDAELPDDVARRARLQFRMDIMREPLDESGEAYAVDCLDVRVC